MVWRKVLIITQEEAVTLNVQREHEDMEETVMNKGNEGTEGIENST